MVQDKSHTIPKRNKDYKCMNPMLCLDIVLNKSLDRKYILIDKRYKPMNSNMFRKNLGSLYKFRLLSKNYNSSLSRLYYYKFDNLDCCIGYRSNLMVKDSCCRDNMLDIDSRKDNDFVNSCYNSKEMRKFHNYKRNRENNFHHRGNNLPDRHSNKFAHTYNSLSCN